MSLLSCDEAYAGRDGNKHIGIAWGGGPEFGGMIGFLAEIAVPLDKWALTAGLAKTPVTLGPSEVDVDVDGYAFGIRRYFDEGKHRMFAQAVYGSVYFRAQGWVTFDRVTNVQTDTSEGASLGIGYRYAADWGFTWHASGSAILSDDSPADAAIGLGLGFAW